MHAVVMDSLEEYLAGVLEPALRRRAVEAHLSTCGSCREEVQAHAGVSHLFGSLRTEEVLDLLARLLRRRACSRSAGAEAVRRRFAGLFALDFAFGRRLVFASLLTLAILGGFLATREAQYPVGPLRTRSWRSRNRPASIPRPRRTTCWLR